MQQKQGYDEIVELYHFLKRFLLRQHEKCHERTEINQPAEQNFVIQRFGFFPDQQQREEKSKKRSDYKDITHDGLESKIENLLKDTSLWGIIR